MSAFTFPCNGCRDLNKSLNCNEDCISWWIYLVNIRIPPCENENLTGEQFPNYGERNFSQ